MSDYQGEKFKDFLKKKSIKVIDAAKMLDMSRSGLYAYFNTKNLGREVVHRLCTVFNVDEDEIFNPERHLRNELENDRKSKVTYREMVKSEIDRDRSNAKYIGEVDNGPADDDGNTRFMEISPGRYRMKIDLVPFHARAGYLAGFGDIPYIEELPKHEITVTKYHKGKYLAFDVVGDSMNDGSINSIPDKSIITGRVLEPELWLPRLHTHNHDYWIFAHKTEGILVKLIKDQDLEIGEITLSSLNPDKNLYPDQVINLKEVYQILNVIKIEREL